MATAMASRHLVLLAFASVLFSSALANWCPTTPCGTIVNLDLLSTVTPSVSYQNQSLNTAEKCRAACPCGTQYFAFLKNGIPSRFYCFCYARCINGTFTGTGGQGGIKHGLICPSICHDPHFVGAHGTRYDFNGELDKSFCLVTDKHVHLNAFFKGYTTEETVGATVLANGKGLRTWMSELGILWVDSSNKKHTLHMAVRKSADVTCQDGFLEYVQVDGVPVAVPRTTGDVLDVGDVSLTFVGPYLNKWGGQEDKFILKVGDRLELQLHVGPAMRVFHRPGDAMVHFSFSVQKLEPSPVVHGVLGQTYRNTPAQLLKALEYRALNHLLRANVQADGVTGYGFMDGKMEDYISSSIMSTDCAMSAFE